MPVNNDAIVVAATGDVYIAAVGAVAPTSPSATPDPLVWSHTGAINDEGATFADSKTLEPIAIWQSFYPARRVVTEKDASVAFAMREWNAVTIPFAYGGGAITEPTAGVYRYTPPAPETIDERAMLVKWIDGTKHYMLILPRGMVTEAIETALAKAAASDLPITFSINGQDDVDPWYLLTDDPAFAPAGS